MKPQRRFSREFKRQVVEELLSGVSTPAQLMRRHEISSGLLSHWKRQYATGGFDNPPNQEAAREVRVRQLEQLVGKLTLENKFLKKTVQRSLFPVKKNGSSWDLPALRPKHPKGVRADEPAAQHILPHAEEEPLESTRRSLLAASRPLLKSFPVTAIVGAPRNSNDRAS